MGFNTIELNGRLVAERAAVEICIRVEALKVKSGGVTPILATILVGDDPSSATYVRMKGNACHRVGMASMAIDMPGSTSTEELLSKIEELNENPAVCGILLQHPVPAQINERLCFDAIKLDKDVDGVTSLGFGRMAMGEQAYGSATPAGIMRLLEAYAIPLAGKHAVVLGRSPILGKPMAAMLLNANCTVTVCHSRTEGLVDFIRQADVLIAAVGKPEFIKGSWIKDGAVVVDAGYHNTDKGGVGDIEMNGVAERCSAWTPVPGGVGPMTINTLILHTLEAGERRLL